MAMKLILKVKKKKQTKLTPITQIKENHFYIF